MKAGPVWAVKRLSVCGPHDPARDSFDQDNEERVHFQCGSTGAGFRSDSIGCHGVEIFA